MSDGDVSIAGRLEERSKPWELLRFQPLSKAPARSCYTIRLAWPVFAWRVVVPDVFQAKITPLERAVLRLARAGVFTSEQMAALLDMPPGLVKSVQNTCADLEYLDNGFRLAEAGEKALAGMDLPELSVGRTAGWIFRDTLTGDVMPMFYDGSLPLAPAAAVNEAVALPYNSSLQAAPSLGNVATALIGYRRILRMSREDEASQVKADHFDPDAIRADDWSELEDPSLSAATSLGSPRFVHLVTTIPEKCDLETHFYIAGDDPETWSIRSPFGLHGGGWFYKKLNAAAERDDRLGALLATWRREAQEMFATPAGAQDRDRARAMNEYPSLAIVPELGSTLRELVRAYRAETLFEQDPDNLDIVLNRYQVVLEAVLTACIRSSPNAEAIARQIEDKDFVNRVTRMASEMGVQLPSLWLNRNLVPKLRRVPSLGGQSLRDRGLFLFLYAYYREESPFRRAMQDDPQLLMSIDAVTDARNQQGAHLNPSVGQRDTARRVVAETVLAAHLVLRTLITSYFGGQDGKKY
jgi:hypothetical protein